MRLEHRKAELAALLMEMPADGPDIHPNVSELNRRKVERLTDALNKQDDRAEAAEAIRVLVEKITLTPSVAKSTLPCTEN